MNVRLRLTFAGKTVFPAPPEPTGSATSRLLRSKAHGFTAPLPTPVPETGP